LTKKASQAKQSSPRPYRTAEEMIKPSRIAEPLAVYSTTRKSSSRAPRRLIERRLAGLTTSEEVWRFAVAHDLIPHLETAVRLVRECFPTVRAIKLLYEVDWEVENRSWIAINIGDIETVGTQEAILERYDRFTRDMVRQVPLDKGEKILLGF
jgi:hypothetical protein